MNQIPTLAAILQQLKDGERIPLSQDGCEVWEDMAFRNGEWIYACKTFGWQNQPIGRAEALSMIRNHIAKKETEARVRQAEIEWLDNAIEELTR